MGIYSNLINMESAAVQDPDNAGVDLDQVEDAVMGDDGIEAHRDEVEAAVAGTVDPVEEAYFAIYEAEYNYNQIMRTIGIRELQEASYGREIVLEGVDIRGFFEKVKNFFVSMFKRITEAFKNVAKILMSSIASDKKLASKYAKDIKSGFEKRWSATGYVFKDDITLEDAHKRLQMFNTDAVKFALAHERTVGLKDTDDYVKRGRTKEDIMQEVAKQMRLGDVSGDKDFRDALTKYFRNNEDEPVELNGRISYDQIIRNLKNDKEVKDIKKDYEKLKDSFSKTISDLKDLEKAVSSESGSNADRNKRMAYVSSCVGSMKNIKSVQTIIYSITLTAAKQKRAQARKMALYFIRHAGGAKHESAGVEGSGIFGSLEMI